jgi:hypothetical protein
LSVEEIIIPCIVAGIPCAGLIITKRFEFGAKAKNKVEDKIAELEKLIKEKADDLCLEKLKEQLRKDELIIAKLTGRLDMVEENNHA